MTLYSDFTAQRTRQIVSDIVAVLGIAAFVVLGVTVHGLVMTLQAAGARLSEAGTSFESTMSEISERLGGIPLIGGGIRAPFDEASGARSTLQSVGQAQQDAVAQLATGLGATLAVVPTVVILLLWLVPRIRFARRSTWARAASSSAAGLDLLACRALAARPLPQIVAAHPDAAGGWRRNDPSAVRALALLELRACGVRPEKAAVLRGSPTALT
jgi:hypothetical protein